MSHGFEDDESSSALASALGISAEQVELYVELEVNESDDGLVYGYTARFDESTPLDVLKAAGVSSDLSVDLGPNTFDEEE